MTQEGLYPMTNTTQTEITINEVEGMLEIAYDNWRTLSIPQRMMVETVSAKLQMGKRAMRAPEPEPTAETGEKINQEPEPGAEPEPSANGNGRSSVNGADLLRTERQTQHGPAPA